MDVLAANRSRWNRRAWIPVLAAAFLAGMWAGPGEAGDSRSDLRRNTMAGTMVIFGASYAKGWTPGELWSMQAQNKGISGEQTHEMLARFDRDVSMQRPQAVLIWGFVNDIFRTERAAIETTLNKTRANIAEMVRIAQQQGIVPLLATEVTIRPKDTWTESVANLVGTLTGKESYQNYVNKHVQATNRWLRMYAQENGLVLLDFEKELSGEDGMRRKEYAADDGSHISPAGYRQLTRYAEGPVASVVEAALVQRRRR